ncbi:hypothetical protein HPG69_019432, partial [Diceros bicornis minor]
VPERIWEHACNPFCLAGLHSGAAELQLLSFVFPAPLPCNGQGLIGTMCEPDMECADVPLLTPSSKEMMSQALKATFSGFSKEQQRLGIPKDPRQWTETHVRDWVMWAVNEFSLKGVDFQKFCMNGAALCALGKDCFLELAPDFVGDILWEHLEILQKEDVKPYQVNGVNPTYPESRYTSDYFISYGIEHAQCVPPSEFSEPSFITESYQTLHPISSEELLSLKYENDYPSVILRDPLQTDTLQTDYFAIKQEVVTPDNMCMGRTSRGKLGGQDSFESIESYDSCDRLTQSWSSQSSFNSLQRVPSYDSFDSEDYPAALPSHKPKGTFKDYVRDRADLNKDKPVIPAAALAGYTGRRPAPTSAASVCVLLWVGSVEGPVRVLPETEVSLFLSGGTGEKKTLRGLGSFPRVVGKTCILDLFPYLGEGNYIHMLSYQFSTRVKVVVVVSEERL